MDYLIRVPKVFYSCFSIFESNFSCLAIKVNDWKISRCALHIFILNSLKSSMQSGNSLITSACSTEIKLQRKAGKSEIFSMEQEMIITT